MPRSLTAPQKLIARILIVGLFLAGPALATLAPGNSRLYDAIDRGDAASVRALLADGADPDSRSRGFTIHFGERYLSPPLVWAIRQNQPAIALALVEAGADPDTHDARGGPSALVLAEQQGMPEVVRALVARGAHRTAEPGRAPDGPR
ncbi:MAG: hypothetical protein R2712_22135 [Vicinamibacterales bacterium]